jgi:hypothetical protein
MNASIASDAIRTSSIASATVAGSPDSMAARRFDAPAVVASSAAWNAAAMTGPTSSAASSRAACPSAAVASRPSMAPSAVTFSGVPACATRFGSRASSSSSSAWIWTP